MALWTPAEIPGAIFLDPDDPTTYTVVTGVSDIQDKNAGTSFATQADTAKQPAVISNGLNGLTTFRFDGSSDVMNHALSITSNNSTIFAVCNRRTGGTSSHQYIFTANGPSEQFKNNLAAKGYEITPWSVCNANWFSSGVTLDTNFRIICAVRTDAPSALQSLYTDGILSSSTSSFTTYSDGVNRRHIGSDGGSGGLWSGELAKLVIVPAVAVDVDIRQRLEGWAAHICGLQANLPADHPYKSVAPTIPDASVTLSLDQPCSLAQRVKLSLDQPIAIRKLLTLSLDQSCGLELSMSLVQRCRAMPTVTMSLNQWLRSLRQVTMRLDQHVGVCPRVRLSLDQHVRMPGRVTLSLDQSVVIAGQLLTLSLDQPVNLANNGRVTMTLAQPCAIANGEAVRQGISLSVTVGGRLVEPDYVSIKADDSDGFMSATIRFPDPAQYALCRVGEVVIITELLDELPAEITVLQVKTLANPEEPGAADHILTAVSPTIALDEKLLTDDLGPGVAKDLMLTLAAGYGITLAWQGVEGWPFLAGELMAEDETAYQVLVRLAAASGAFIQSLPDGATIRLRPEYAKNIGDWPTAATDLEINDQDHIFSIDEQPDERDGFNAFMVGGQSSAAGNYRLDDKVLTATTKEIRFYQWPWNEAAAIVLGHTGGDWVSIDYLGVHEEIVTDENVVVTAGIGRLQLPFYGIASYRYKEDGLGAPSFEEDGSIATAVIGDALLDVTYLTKYRRWLLTDPRAEHLLIYVD